jgi:hypothetical protein
MNTIEILRQHFQAEYSYTRVSVQMAKSQKEKNSCIWYAIQRCLGMATISQSFGASFEEAWSLYEEIKNKIMTLGD